MTVSGVIKFAQTPAPQGISLIVGEKVVETGPLGVFSADVSAGGRVSISSALPAVAITPRVGLGADLSRESPITIAAYRMIEPAPTPPCRAFVGADEVVFWPYINYTNEALVVPESLSNFSDNRAPAETLFAPGFTNSFARRLDLFRGDGAGVSGRWNILGLSVELPNPIPMCVDRGDPGQCPQISAADVNAIFDDATRIVTDAYTRSLIIKRKLRKRGWESTGEPDRLVTRGKRVTLPKIKRIIRQVQPVGAIIYRCDKTQAIPASCMEYTFPKEELQNTIVEYFSIELEPAFQRVVSNDRLKRELERFDQVLDRLPDKYYRCDE